MAVTLVRLFLDASSGKLKDQPLLVRGVAVIQFVIVLYLIIMLLILVFNPEAYGLNAKAKRLVKSAVWMAAILGIMDLIGYFLEKAF